MATLSLGSHCGKLDQLQLYPGSQGVGEKPHRVTHGRSLDTCSSPHHKLVAERDIAPWGRCAADFGSIAGWVAWCVHVATQHAAP
ncbi:hypothetical protein GOP47_0010775 [Adiantum capillus-veneris]|uniref:Uncharacterized protein n=1 Tax=Adiantum capillus-veneris TaxID=13818 RepID=A0A9D4ZGQ5_ADICA|nr:hypothetical protein GOP47_0010775 [Adiantum capillus-veneris]